MIHALLEWVAMAAYIFASAAIARALWKDEKSQWNFLAIAFIVGIVLVCVAAKSECSVDYPCGGEIQLSE